jgi:hypothetical protein
MTTFETNFALKEGMKKEDVLTLFRKGENFLLNGKKVTIFSCDENELLYGGKVLVKQGKNFFRAKVLYLQVV